MEYETEVVIVGAGAAGLATAACLARRGVRSILLEASSEVGHAWASAYDALHLHTVRRYSGLPLRPMPRSYPRYASRDQVVAYLQDYAARQHIDVRLNQLVRSATRTEIGWRVVTASDVFTCRALVAASGVVANPYVPSYPGMEVYSGTLLHSSAYRNAAAYAGKRVLVIGAGNSGAEIAMDLMRGGAAVTVAIRQGVNAVPLSLLGVPIQYWALLVARLPRPVTEPLARMLLRRSTVRLRRAGLPKSPEPVLEAHGIPIIGLSLLEATQAQRIGVVGAIARFTPTGVCLVDGRELDYDAIILATGFHPALSYLAGLVSFDARGFPARDRARSTQYPNLFFMGYNYGIVGTLNNIRLDAPVVAGQIAHLLRQRAPISAPA
jgi:cation diffusion facilitator CzcD-associated flavoprotein CzcO